MTLLFGHRGVRAAEGRADVPPENTLAAFEAAFAEGADGVELDARTCADEVVVFHDADLRRLTGGTDRRRVDDVRFADLPRLGGEPIPRLVDALSLAASRGAVVNVELKHDVRSRRALARAAAALMRASRAEILLSSFDPMLLSLVAARWPASRRAWLTSPMQRGIGAALDLLARRGPIEAVHLERTQATPARIRALRARRLVVGVWTINAAAEAQDLAALGVERLISDVPGVLRAALGPR